MEKELLEECLAKGMSLEAIGERVGKHESTVGYWLKKHGLVAARAEKHAAKGAVSREDLEPLLAAGLSLREIAHRLDRSLATIRHWMRKYDLKPPPRRKRGTEDGPREMVSQCKHHGETGFVREGRGYYRCKRCRLERVAQRRRIVKRRLVEEAGGIGMSRSLKKSRAEARKCVLLCANCHREVEAGITAVPLNSVPDVDPV